MNSQERKILDFGYRQGLVDSEEKKESKRETSWKMLWPLAAAFSMLCMCSFIFGLLLYFFDTLNPHLPTIFILGALGWFCTMIFLFREGLK